VKSNKTSGIEAGRRSFLKKASYIAPAILTMTALPSFASVGSGAILKEEKKERSEISPDAKKEMDKKVADAQKKIKKQLADAKK
jgi:hypothetical protein